MLMIPPALCPWQKAPHTFKEALVAITNGGDAEIIDLPLIK